MAWSFRKRIKIADGFYLNIGKTGPSITVGGKGHSVNYGSKGAYLNTSLPGTGLRNRQKISSINKDTKISEKSNIGFVIVISFLLIGIVSFFTFCFFSDLLNIFYLLIPAVLIFLLIFVLCVSSKENTSEEEQQQLLLYPSLEISEDDYNRINRESKRLVGLLKICENQIDNCYKQAISDLIFVTNKTVGKQIEPTDKEALGILLFIANIDGIEIEFTQYELKKLYIESFSNFFENIETNSFSQLADVVTGYKLKMQYLDVMSNYCLVISSIFPVSQAYSSGCNESLENLCLEYCKLHVNELVTTNQISFPLDNLLKESYLLLMENQSSDFSILQKKLEIGYNRSQRILNTLEVIGIVGEHRIKENREFYFCNSDKLQKYLLTEIEKLYT